MSHNPRIEEISDTDSDPADMDPSDFDPQRNANSSIIRPSDIPSSSSPASSNPQAQPQFRAAPSSDLADRDRERTKHWQCLYPVYFDSTRTRAEGRRVSKSQAVLNPLAREIAKAASLQGLNVVFEPTKLHPKDWSNPGRVRILIKEEGRNVTSHIHNKHHLYNLVSEYLKAHPTTEEMPLQLRIAGMPTPAKPIVTPAIPRGWKMNTILPLHSPALSGGGVSDNLFKDMMAEMQGGQADGTAAIKGAGEDKKKKDKKKGKA